MDSTQKNKNETIIDRLAEIRQWVSEQGVSKSKRERLEEQLRFQAQLLDSVREAVVVTDLEEHVVYWGKGAEDLYGYSAEEMMGQPVLPINQPLNKYQKKKRLNQVLQTGYWHGEYMQQRKDGSSFWAESMLSLVTDSQGNPYRLLGINRDVTNRIRETVLLQRHNRDLKLLNQAGQALNATLNMDQILTIVLDQIHRMINVTACSVWLIDPETNELVCRQAVGPKSEIVRGWRLAPGEGVAGWVAQNGKSVIVPDTRSDKRHFKSVDQQIEVELRSILSVPLRIKKEVIGALHMLHEVADYFRPVDQTLLESLAASAAIAIDNARLFQENQQQTRQFQRLMDNVQDGILLLDAERRIKIANLKAQAYLTALTNIDVGETLSQVGPHPLDVILNQADSDQWFEVKLSGSRTYTVQVAARNIAGETDLASWMILLRDVTGERAIQARVLQQERLAAVAQLTEGVAHHFNNILTSIIGYAELASFDSTISHSIREDIDRVIKEGKRAAFLTHKIMNFSQEPNIKEQSLDFIHFLKENVKMLKLKSPNTINIHLEIEVEGEVCLLKADPILLEQMLANLVVNAQEAMPNGGNLKFHLSNLTIEPDEPSPNLGIPAGEWAVLSMVDTGIGISSEDIWHIFEPFFTTKEASQRFGLGLAQVYGIVKQHGGEITVSSNPNEGTTFKIYLPKTAFDKD